MFTISVYKSRIMTSYSAPPSADRAHLHYAWIIVGTGVLVMFSCLGLARFAFGVLLPPMAEALDLNYTQRGTMGTGYFVGYLAMVALAPALVKRLNFRASIVLGLIAIALSMGLLAISGAFIPALACYTVTGVGSGAANIAMMALIASWFAPSLRGMATGLVIAGNGLGISVSGFLVPYVVDVAGATGWRWGWGVLAMIVALVCVIGGGLLRNSPKDKGLEMAGSFGRRPPPPLGAPGLTAEEKRLLLLLGVIYFCFGTTYMIYGTFFVTSLIDEHGFSGGLAGRFWSWVGFFSMFSGPVFGRISDTFSRKAGLMAAFAVQTAAYALASLRMGTLPIYLSVALYGLAAWAIPTIMTATIADRLGPLRTAAGFSFITFFFAVGQVLGPFSAGLLADISGGFSISYIASSALTLLGLILAIMVPRSRPLSNT